jgi:hypothetical protein
MQQLKKLNLGLIVYLLYNLCIVQYNLKQVQAFETQYYLLDWQNEPTARCKIRYSQIICF